MARRIAVNDEQDMFLETEIFPFNWEPRLKLDTIVTSTWTAPSGITLGALSFNTTATQAFITATAVGEHCIINEITTAQGKTLKGRLTLTVTKACE